MLKSTALSTLAGSMVPILHIHMAEQYLFHSGIVWLT